ncbi:MAG: hypothetical protein M0Z88_03695 [Actinomycetota bacterium]|nr:hypothetical protein [Actinomycetota bacterium]
MLERVSMAIWNGVCPVPRCITSEGSRGTRLCPGMGFLIPFRAGRLAQGLVVGAPAIEGHGGLVTTTSDESELRGACVSGWLADRRPRFDTAMLTFKNEDVEALNDIAHSMLGAAGEIGEPLVHLNAAREHAGVPSRTYNKGERIVFLRNESMARVGENERVDVRNSNVGVLLGLDWVNQFGEVELDNGARTWVKLSYLQEHTAYGYARTVHQTQGATIGRQDPERVQLGTAHIYRPELLGFEAAHVASSRPTHSASLYVLEEAVPGEPAAGEASGIDARRAAMESVEHAWGQRRAERSATDYMEIAQSSASRRSIGAPHKVASVRRPAASLVPRVAGATEPGAAVGSTHPSGILTGVPGQARQPNGNREAAAVATRAQRPRRNEAARFMSISQEFGTPGAGLAMGGAVPRVRPTGAPKRAGEPANSRADGFRAGSQSVPESAANEQPTRPGLEL